MLRSKNVEAVIKSNPDFFFSQVKKEKKISGNILNLKTCAHRQLEVRRINDTFIKASHGLKTVKESVIQNLKYENGKPLKSVLIKQ